MDIEDAMIITDTEEEKTSWRDVFKVHPAAKIFPMLPKEKLLELGEDIKANGLKVKITLFDDGNSKSLLDGRNRLDGSELVGVETVRKTAEGQYELAVNYEVLSNIDPYHEVISRNIHRRHLTPKQVFEATMQAMDLLNKEESDKATACKPLQPVKPRGRAQVQEPVARISEATDLSIPTVRKHVVEIIDEKLASGEITPEQAEKIRPKKKKARDNEGPIEQDRYLFENDWNPGKTISRINKSIDSELKKIQDKMTSQARERIGKALVERGNRLMNTEAA